MSEEKNLEEGSKPHAASGKQENLSVEGQAPQQKKINDKPETPNMEVHKHPHHATHKKKWGEYFLEFLMIFLAVFLGFVAENLREHEAEKKRGKEYIHSFYEDLKYDISRMDGILATEAAKVAALRKMRDCFDTIKQKWTSTSCLIDLLKNSRSNNSFQITNRTLNQLGNAGGFRLLRTQDADSIVSYQNDAINLRDYESTLYQQAQDNVRNTSMDLVEFSANSKLNSGVTDDPSAFNTNVNAPLLLSDNKELLNKYFNHLLQYLRAIVRHRLLLIDLKNRATRIVDYFNHNYHLE